MYEINNIIIILALMSIILCSVRLYVTCKICRYSVSQRAHEGAVNSKLLLFLEGQNA